MKKSIAALISLTLCAGIMLSSCSKSDSSSVSSDSSSKAQTTATTSVAETESTTAATSAAETTAETTTEATTTTTAAGNTTTTAAAATTTAKAAAPANVSADTITATDLLGMTVDQALALGNNSFEMTYPKGIQDGTNDMYKCNSFSAYTFKSSEGNSGMIDNLNLYYGGRIDDMVFTGLTYSQIETYIVGMTISYSYDDLEFASFVDYAGHKWEIGYDLTDAQKAEIKSRLDKASNAGDYGQNTAAVSILDLDPVSSVIVYKTSLN